MTIKIIDRDDNKRLLLVRNSTQDTYDVLITRPNLPGRFPKPLYENYELLEQFGNEEEARRKFEGIRQG